MNQLEANRGVQILDGIYEKCLNGVPKVSKPVEEFANDYIKKYGRTDKDINKLVKNQISKNSINGFVTGFGGFPSTAVTLPANITSVLYVQMRMIAAIAIIREFDLNDDEVQTFVYMCLAGTAVVDTLKKAGIQVGNRIALNTIKKVPGSVFIKINQKVGFRFITKMGQKGVVNLGKSVPVVGAGVGALMDYSTTKLIANRAKKMFEGKDIINISEVD